MSTLLFVLAAIGLLDSTSMVPICVIPLAVILGGSRPIAGAAGFLAGIFAVYAGAGFLLLVGFDALFDAVGPSLSRWWNQPNTPELILQIIVGGLMLGFAWRLAKSRQSRGRPDLPEAISPASAFVLGGGLTVVGLPGALPYFGAIDQILRADLSIVASVAALVFYNVVFLTPLATLLVVRLLFPAHSGAIFGRVASLAERWGRHLIVLILLGVGLVLVADGVGWFLGHPLLPVDPAAASSE